MDVQRGSRAVPVSPPPRTVLTIDETAALLRVDRRQVAATIARRQLQVITHDGATLVDGDALWVRLDPLATQLPRQLMEAMTHSPPPGSGPAADSPIEPPAGAELLARDLLTEVGSRWAHTQAVAAAAARAGAGLDDHDRQALVTAAWLHDIGYAPARVRTGFHALDGAVTLLDRGFPLRIAALVAHHSMSIYEAEVRGLRGQLKRFPAEHGPVADALVWADMTTTPQGRPTNVEDRLAEILDRYPAGDPVYQAIKAASPDILSAACRTESRLAALVRCPM